MDPKQPPAHWLNGGTWTGEDRPTRDWLLRTWRPKLPDNFRPHPQSSRFEMLSYRNLENHWGRSLEPNIQKPTPDDLSLLEAFYAQPRDGTVGAARISLIARSQKIAGDVIVREDFDDNFAWITQQMEQLMSDRRSRSLMAEASMLEIAMALHFFEFVEHGGGEKQYWVMPAFGAHELSVFQNFSRQLPGLSIQVRIVFPSHSARVLQFRDGQRTPVVP